METDFVLSDCGRQIQLDFELDPASLPNSLHKVDVLLDTLTRFRAALVEEGRLAAERERQARLTKAAKVTKVTKVTKASRAGTTG